ncbi:hypothetical protein V502_06003 [Pseudogymnoascus sp. VKM F-4520 (FW-2644)]|nr:hypothetical protein V502_06003 [Pseudogymnoascus sp. VKM F-4520 (FW-2644)]
MAEPFGIVAGAVGIAAAFTACVDCFKYVHLGQNLKRDYQTEQLSLSCAKLRLTRWGQAVNVLDDPQLGRRDATPAELQVVKGSLHQMLVLFADSEKISKKYAPDSSSMDAPSEDLNVVALNSMIETMVEKRQKGPSILRTAAWAVHRRGELKELVSNITGFINNIEQLFPAPQARRELAQREVAEIQDTRVLELLEQISRGVDNLLRAAVGEALAGHQYKNVTIKGKAQVGDAVASGWSGGAAGLSHTYDGVQVDVSGKALLGNSRGGKGFWND